MRVSSPSSTEAASSFVRDCLLAVIALLALTIIVALTGGFVLDLGPLHLSVRRWPGPLVLATLTLLAAVARGGRARTIDDLRRLPAWLDRYALVMALVAAAAVAGVGVAFGTYAAAGSDSAGYVSQARLLADGRVTDDEPLVRELSWPDAPDAFAPLAFHAAAARGVTVPTYPPGLPLLMAPAARAWSFGPYLVIPLLGALLLVITYALGARLHSRTTGLVATLLLATSPILLFQVVQPMSDVAATAWWALAFLLATVPALPATAAAGLVAGVALLTRPNLVLLGVALAGWVALQAVTRRGGIAARLTALALGVSPAGLVMSGLNAHLYGSPFASGYGDISDFFDRTNVVPNVSQYAARVLGGEPALLGLVLATVGLLLARPRAEREPALRRAGALAALAAGAILASYLPYGQFPDWFYLRFLLPAWPMLFVLAAALTTRALGRLPVPLRVPLLAIVLALVIATNLRVARGHAVFDLHAYESRYRIVGEYGRTALPANAVVLAVQQSASLRHYTGLPVLRWDLLDTPLDLAVEELRRLRRTPYLLIEDWEEPAFRARFARTRYTDLDWAPRAELAGTTRVRLFALDDAERPSNARYVTDRLRSDPVR